MLKHFFFADSLLIVSYVQAALGKQQEAAYCSFYRAFSINYFFFFWSAQVMLLCLHKRTRRANLFKTNIPENKTNFITDIFFLKYYLNKLLKYF